MFGAYSTLPGTEHVLAANGLHVQLRGIFCVAHKKSTSTYLYVSIGWWDVWEADDHYSLPLAKPARVMCLPLYGRLSY